MQQNYTKRTFAASGPVCIKRICYGSNRKENVPCKNTGEPTIAMFC